MHGPEWTLVQVYGLRRDLPASCHTSGRSADGRQDFVIAARKGAPEAIGDLCHLSLVSPRIWSAVDPGIFLPERRQ